MTDQRKTVVEGLRRRLVARSGGRAPTRPADKAAPKTVAGKVALPRACRPLRRLKVKAVEKPPED